METGIGHRHDIGLIQKIRGFEQLEALEASWIGPDLALEKKVLVPPLGMVETNLILNKTDLPPIDLTRGALGNLEWSVRSCLAQSGTEIRFHQGDLSDQMIKDINAGKNVSIPVRIQSYVQRPIELEGNVMRFFWTDSRRRLTGAKLREALKSDLIIEGIEGTDWSLKRSDSQEELPRFDEKYADRMKELTVELSLKGMFYIPESIELIRVRSKRDLSGILEKIPEGKEPVFKIGETPKVKLSENIIAVIDTWGEGGQRHINSPLVDPGFADSIRTETTLGLDRIELRIYKK